MYTKRPDMTISLFAGIGRNRELGKGNELLWPVPDDLKYFKRATMGNPIIMGSKTFDSIGRPLPGRKNIVITRDTNRNIEGACVVHTLEEAFDESDTDEAFVIGGGQIYEAALPYADKLYLTLFDAEDADADAFFPDYSAFTKKTLLEEREHNGLSYSWTIFER